ncbi:hypothetical protein [Arcobacter sp. FWKO B]|nr:hypothetical protein [Arcobacter sp. FWKO B]
MKFWFWMLVIAGIVGLLWYTGYTGGAKDAAANYNTLMRGG